MDAGADGVCVAVVGGSAGVFGLGMAAIRVASGVRRGNTPTRVANFAFSHVAT